MNSEMTEFEVPPSELQALLYPDEQVRPAWGIPDYWVTDKGRIFSCKRKNPCQKSTHYDGRGSERDNKDKGYERVRLSIGKRESKLFAVQILVWEAFNGHRPEGMQVCHNDGDNRNNTLSNLRLDTRKNNCADRRKHGTENLGEKCGTSKLTNEQALEIYRRAWSDQEKLVDIAKEFDIRPNTVSAIKNGQNWSSITNHLRFSTP
jgi:hypothetical protein